MSGAFHVHNLKYEHRESNVENSFSLPVVLSFVTLLVVLCVGIYQLRRVRGSQKKRNERPGGIAGPE